MTCLTFVFTEMNWKECCICLKGPDDLLHLPCCASAEPSIMYCKSCLKGMCSNKDSKLSPGECPCCKRSFQVELTEDKVVKGVIKWEKKSQCGMCKQTRTLVSHKFTFCEKCLLGKLYMFTYECHRCHNKQKISHPMWQYQKTKNEFGHSVWACHVGCDDYTYWKIIPEDAKEIPGSYIPDSWKEDNEWTAYLWGGVAICLAVWERFLSFIGRNWIRFSLVKAFLRGSDCERPLSFSFFSLAWLFLDFLYKYFFTFSFFHLVIASLQCYWI